MNRSVDRVLGGVAIVAALAGALVVVQLPLAAPLCAIIFGVLSVATLVWTAAEQAEVRRAGYPALLHAPWVLLALTAIVALAWALPFFVLLPSGSSVVVALVVFIALLAYVAYLPSTLLFWHADEAGLTQHLLSFRRTLPWSAIDWVYGASQTNTQAVYQVVTVAKWTDRVLIVEAGPKRSMRVLLASLLVGGDPKPLLAAIQTHATSAHFGFDQMPAVQRARQGSQPEQLHSQPIAASEATLADAIRQARTGVVPNGWSLFPVQQGAVWINLASSAVIGVALIAAMCYLYFSGQVIVPSFIPSNWLGSQTTQIIGIVELVLAVLLGLGLIALALRWTRALAHPTDYFFLVTPRYFAAVRGERVRAAELAAVRRFVTANGFYGLQIRAEMRSGQKLAFDFGKLFGPPRTIYGHLQSALRASAPHPSPSSGLDVTLETEG